MRFTGLKYLQLLACLGLFACGSAERYDVVIVGGGASGTAAGLQAARMLSLIHISEPTRH